MTAENCERLNVWRFIVDDEDDGIRLDHFLTEQDFQWSDQLSLTRSRIKKLIDMGEVTVDGAPAWPAKKLHPNQQVALSIPPLEPLTLSPEEIPLNIPYQDDYLVVVDKQQGLVVHPGPGHPGGTLVNGLLFLHALSGGDPLRPGIVHRLDKDTSGLMVVAKREDAHAALAVQFHDHTVDRRYLAIVSGSPPDEGRWETLHARSPTNRRRFSSKVTRGKQAVSFFKTVERFAGASMIAITLRTGRTHQVRVHCHDHGFPVLGDRLYGPRHLSNQMRAIHDVLPGQALHAELLGFDHPATSERLRFHSEPPDCFRLALDALRGLH